MEHLGALADFFTRTGIDSQNPRRKDQPVKIDLGAWLAAHGRDRTREGSGRAGCSITSRSAPSRTSSTDGAFAIQFNNGANLRGLQAGPWWRWRTRAVAVAEQLRTKSSRTGQRTEPAEMRHGRGHARSENQKRHPNGRSILRLTTRPSRSSAPGWMTLKVPLTGSRGGLRCSWSGRTKTQRILVPRELLPAWRRRWLRLTVRKTKARRRRGERSSSSSN